MKKADERELILINVTGADRCGVTTALTEILARYDADILDMGQADIHHTPLSEYFSRPIAGIAVRFLRNCFSRQMI